MSVEAREGAKPGRKPRADAQRNRERLVEAAKAVFDKSGAEASLEEIARAAGVGIGTLYRHFPTRDALLEAVYRREFVQLAETARRLLDSATPGAALHEWMRLFVDYIATKKVVAPALGAALGEISASYAASGMRLTEALSQLVGRAAASGDIRADADPEDILLALVGITYGNTSPNWRASALRLIDILMDGLRAPGGGAETRP
ncbi:TetR/AcrR family transcriptional regulator [Phenylobacterium sp.]|uniref:TetR/AcrR family transcriptional regulator n=1 Tax=Phenylobacterium sp. TaxID=1871053 RepID=UPI0035AFC0EE